MNLQRFWNQGISDEIMSIYKFFKPVYYIKTTNKGEKWQIYLKNGKETDVIFYKILSYRYLDLQFNFYFYFRCFGNIVYFQSTPLLLSLTYK